MRVLKINNYQNNKQQTFEAMKPNQFKGLNYAVVRKFKAPVEKFKNIRDFQRWAKVLLKMNYGLEYRSLSSNINKERKTAITKWKNFIKSKEQEWQPAKSLLVYLSMMKNLKFANDEVPPVINEKVLEESLALIDKKLNFNKDLRFDFNKLYKSKLKTYFLNDLPENYTGWVKIMPKSFDSENYERNVERLKLLSNKNWCTRKDKIAKSHLEKEEIHIYLEKGCSKLAVRLAGFEVKEVQGEKNNSVIPMSYLDELKKYLEEGGYFLNEDMKFILEFSQVMD